MPNNFLGPRQSVDVQFLRTLGGISEIGLAIFLEEMSKTEGIDALLSITEYLEQDGFPKGGALDPRVSFRVKQSGACDARTHVSSFPEMVLRLITPAPGHPIDSAALDLVARLAKLRPESTFRQSEFVCELIRLSLPRIHDAAFVKALLDLDPWSNLCADPLIDEAARHENAAAASALVLHDHCTFNFEKYMQRNRRYGKERTAPHRWAQALRSRPSDVFALLDALDRRFGEAKGSLARARILSFYLRLSLQTKVSWDAGIVQSLMGSPTSPARKAMSEAANAVIPRGPNAGKLVTVPWGDLYQDALKAHCPDVLHLFERQLRAKASMPIISHTDDPVAVVVRDTTHAVETFDAQRFQNTLALLVSHGHRLNRIDGGRRPALGNVALSTDDLAVRLRIAEALLCMDCDPHQSFGQGTVSDQFHDDDRTEWDALVRAFAAGKVAHFWFERDAQTRMKTELRSRAHTRFEEMAFGWDAEDGHRPVPEKTHTVASLVSRTGAPIVFAQGQGSLAHLVSSGLVDYVVMDGQTGFTPLSANARYLARELSIPMEQITRLANWVERNEETTLVALKTRRPGGQLKGLILVPGLPSASYWRRQLPRALYEMSRAAIAHAAIHWGAQRMGISHLSRSQGFSSGIAGETAAAAMLDDSSAKKPLRSVTFFGCCIHPAHLARIGDCAFDEESKQGVQGVNVVTDSRGEVDLIHLSVKRPVSPP